MKNLKDKYQKNYYRNYSKDLDYKTSNIGYLYKEKILPHLGNIKANSNIADIGCAYGILLSLIDKEGKYKTYGVDISDYAIKEARKNTRAKLMVSDVEKSLPFNNNFCSALLAIDLIEHLKSPANFCDEVKRVLKKNGLFFIQTPNINSLFEKIHKKNWFGYKDSTHLYLFNRKSLAFLLKQSGFKIIENKTIFYPLFVNLRKLTENTNIGGSIWVVAQK